MMVRYFLVAVKTNYKKNAGRDVGTTCQTQKNTYCRDADKNSEKNPLPVREKTAEFVCTRQGTVKANAGDTHRV